MLIQVHESIRCCKFAHVTKPVNPYEVTRALSYLSKSLKLNIVKIEIDVGRFFFFFI